MFMCCDLTCYLSFLSGHINILVLVIQFLENAGIHVDVTDRNVVLVELQVTSKVIHET